MTCNQGQNFHIYEKNIVDISRIDGHGNKIGCGETSKKKSTCITDISEVTNKLAN